MHELKKPLQPPTSSTAGPLLSWDIFMQHYHSIVAVAEDARRLQAIMRKERWVNEWDLDSLLFKQRKVVLITDSTQRIIFASQNIILLNGYHANEVIGRTPKLFQGPATNPLDTATIRAAITAIRPFDVCLTNYKKNGQTYHCDIQGFPVHAKQKSTSHFIAFEQSAGHHWF